MKKTIVVFSVLMLVVIGFAITGFSDTTCPNFDVTVYGTGGAGGCWWGKTCENVSVSGNFTMGPSGHTRITVPQGSYTFCVQNSGIDGVSYSGGDYYAYCNTLPNTSCPCSND